MKLSYLEEVLVVEVKNKVEEMDVLIYNSTPNHYPIDCQPVSFRNVDSQKDFVNLIPLSNSIDCSEEEEFSQFLFAIQNLLLKYKMYNKSSKEAVVSGGLQQFITKKLRQRSEQGSSAFQNISSRLRALYRKDDDIVTLQKGPDDQSICFIQHLPVDLKLHIFSFLDPKSLCMACCVNKEWSHLTCDKYLWKNLLEKDIQGWNQISYLTNPKMYKAINSDWTNKEIYLKCSPVFQKLFHQSNFTFNQVSSVLKSLLPKKVPKVAMFGPGLEQSTSGLVRQMLYVENDLFTKVAMFPGQEGIGGGMTLKMDSGHSFHLSVLYTASRAERENRAGGDRMEGNRMLQRQAGQDNNKFTLSPQLKHFSQTVDAYIFVIDASETPKAIADSRNELELMLRERTSSPHVPVLILSCVKQPEVMRLPACEIVELLNLTDMSHPWLVMDCESESLKCVDKGIVWLVDQAQYK